MPHTKPTPDYDWCAYTAKVRRWANLMISLGYEVIVYGGLPLSKLEKSSTKFEHISTTSKADAKKWWPQWKDIEPWPGWAINAEWWNETNKRNAQAMTKIFKNGDILAITGGRCQAPIVEMLRKAKRLMTVIEWAVGYSGVFSDRRVFESNAWRHHIYGRIGVDRGSFYDTVIPNFYEPSEYYNGDGLGGYLLFIGRRIESKGLEIVEAIAQRQKLVVAGQGGYPLPSAVKDVGVIVGQAKKKLIGRARAVIVPTLYLEPFGGVAVEAMLNGTPVITTDFGAFTETVAHGVSGFRCRSYNDFIIASDLVDQLDRVKVANWARSRYTVEAVRDQWADYMRYITDYSNGLDWYSTVNGTMRVLADNQVL